MVANPICVNVIRGVQTESSHRGRVVIYERGKRLLSHGDTGALVYPRSAIKFLQAIPVLESGAHEHFGFTEEEVAILGASHNGEPRHVRVVRSMLSKMGLTESALECGIHWPMRESVARDLAARGEVPSSLHNNCSGKHVGMLAYCLMLGIDYGSYIEFDHPVQVRIRETIEEICEIDLRVAPFERDGCSVPTWSFPLENLALGFSKIGDPGALSVSHAVACDILYGSIVRNPYMVAGAGRYCSAAMLAGGGRIFVKVGAEGVYCAAVPEFGLGIALKCDDGAVRGAEAMMSGVLRYIFGSDDLLTGEFRDFINDGGVMSNFNGYAVGRIEGVDLGSRGDSVI